MIVTERLVLREVNINDADFILDLLNSKGWLQFIGDRNVRSLPDAEKYIADRIVKSYIDHGLGLYLVELKTSGTAIGLCGLIKRETLDDIDIGFAFLPEYNGFGYAFEAAISTLQFAFESLEINRLVAITTPDNINSIKLLEKIGMQFEKKILFEEKEELFLFGISNQKK
ncbi:MAG: GNAT family N-acetyltransferase [Bacteroidetes bacterium]|nr:GNAT family N-acetyltransferase [Bacteroidota bacterium]